MSSSGCWTNASNSNELAVIIARRPCILIAKQLKQYENSL